MSIDDMPKIPFAIVLLLIACAAPERTGRIHEWKGHFGPASAGHVVISDAPSWLAFWKEIGQPIPNFDFDKSIAVAAWAGEKPTGGYAIEFLKPSLKNGVLTVRYQVKRPDGFAAQVITRPWAVHAYPRPAKSVMLESAP